MPSHRYNPGRRVHSHKILQRRQTVRMHTSSVTSADTFHVVLTIITNAIVVSVPRQRHSLTRRHLPKVILVTSRITRFITILSRVTSRPITLPRHMHTRRISTIRPLTFQNLRMFTRRLRRTTSRRRQHAIHNRITRPTNLLRRITNSFLLPNILATTARSRIRTLKPFITLVMYIRTQLVPMRYRPTRGRRRITKVPMSIRILQMRKRRISRFSRVHSPFPLVLSIITPFVTQHQRQQQ